MAWADLHGLATRLSSLPLVLCGPILRRVESHTVSVFVALSHPREITLEIYQGQVKFDTLIQSGFVGKTRSTAIGKFLHVAVVTAQITLPSEKALLTPGQIYGYNLVFSPIDQPDPNELDANTTDLLGEQLLSGSLPLGYVGVFLPSFSLPPVDLNALRIVHGSCRQPHATGLDAFVALDDMISTNFSDANNRPHQLFLTGDQIYADDVADGLLLMLTDAAEAIFGWKEQFDNTPVSDFKPGDRQATVEKHGLRSGDSQSHLIGLGEYVTMYLFVWSEALWPTTPPDTWDLPKFAQRFGSLDRNRLSLWVSMPPGAKLLDEDRDVPLFNEVRAFFEKHDRAAARLRHFHDFLPKVRRALANVPTYMIFDDHEVTDDWALNRRWWQEVLNSKSLGREIIRNAMAAYAICQAWGNTPSQFETGKTGDKLVTAVSRWAASRGTSESDSSLMAHLVGLPATAEESKSFLKDLALEKKLSHIGNRPWNQGITWHYRYVGSKYEVIVLDTRTWRGYAGKSVSDFPELLSDEALPQQLQSPTSSQIELIIVVSPAPIIGIPAIEHYQESHPSYEEKKKNDAESWNLRHVSFERFLARLSVLGPGSDERCRAVFLSGDVHYGFTARLQYWGAHPFRQPGRQGSMVAAQLTSSGFKREIGGGKIAPTTNTHAIHDAGFDIRRGAFWHRASEKLLSKKVGRRTFRALGWENPNPESTTALGKLRYIPFSPFDIEFSDFLLKGPMRVFVLEDLAIVGAGEPMPVELIVSVKHPPDWKYLVNFIEAELELSENAPFEPLQVSFPRPPEQLTKLREYMAKAARIERAYLKKDGPGKQLVGKNNIGEISFRWRPNDDKAVIHTLWWRLKDTKDGEMQPFPLTRFIVSLAFSDSKFPEPNATTGSMEPK